MGNSNTTDTTSSIVVGGNNAGIKSYTPNKEYEGSHHKVIITTEKKKRIVSVRLATLFYQYLDFCSVEAGETYEQVLINDQIFNRRDHGNMPMGAILDGENIEITFMKEYEMA